MTGFSGLALDPPVAPPDPARAFEAAVRALRGAAHERALSPPAAKAFRAQDDAFSALVDLVRIRDRELAELGARVRRLEGGDP